MELDDLRKIIDSCDAQIVELLNKRLAAATEIGRRKHAAGAPVFVPEREKAVFEKVCGLNKGPALNETVRAVYVEIMSGALALEQGVSVAAVAESYRAAQAKFGRSVPYRIMNDPGAVYTAVRHGGFPLAVVPESMRADVPADLKIVAEFTADSANWLVLGR